MSTILTQLGVRDGIGLLTALGIDIHAGQIEDLKLLAAGQRQQLGDLLQLAKRLTHEQLQDALAEQRRSGQKIGQILVQRGFISAAECELVLSFQQHQGEQAPGQGKLCLGNVLVASGYVSTAQLANGLQHQALHGGRLGDALVAAAQVSEHQIKQGLQLQRKLLVAVLLGALALAASLVPGPVQAASKSASVQVSAVIRSSAHLRTDFQADQLHITEKDIERGYVEIPAASRFSVVTPKGGSYVVDFHPRSDWFRSVHIEGLGSQVQLGADGGTVTQSGAGLAGVASTLSYRFELKHELQAGVYEWPLLLAVRAGRADSLARSHTE